MTTRASRRDFDERVESEQADLFIYKGSSCKHGARACSRRQDGAAQLSTGLKFLVLVPEVSNSQISRRSTSDGDRRSGDNGLGSLQAMSRWLASVPSVSKRGTVLSSERTELVHDALSHCLPESSGFLFAGASVNPVGTRWCTGSVVKSRSRFAEPEPKGAHVSMSTGTGSKETRPGSACDVHGSLTVRRLVRALRR